MAPEVANEEREKSKKESVYQVHGDENLFKYRNSKCALHGMAVWHQLHGQVC